MSTALSYTQGWITSDEMRVRGFTATGPEIDYGMRWGDRYNIRVRYVPVGDGTDGYLYAHDRETDRCLVLTERTTLDRYVAAWNELRDLTSSPDAYLVFASLARPLAPLPIVKADDLLRHCLDREMAAYRAFSVAPADEMPQLEFAHALIVERSARVAAEQLQIESARAIAEDNEPVVIRYRIEDRSPWNGRVAGQTLDAAVGNARQLQHVAGSHQLTVRATSVSHGHTVVAAPRVPELKFITHSAPNPSNAPRLEL